MRADFSTLRRSDNNRIGNNDLSCRNWFNPVTLLLRGKTKRGTLMSSNMRQNE